MNLNREKLGFLSYIGKIVRFINHHNPMYILISVVSLGMLGLLPIASIQLTQIMINSIQTGENNQKFFSHRLDVQARELALLYDEIQKRYSITFSEEAVVCEKSFNTFNNICKMIATQLD